LLTLALEQRRVARERTDVDQARSLVAMGLLRTEQARFDEAERLVREGLALARRGGRTDADAAVTGAMEALGHVLQQRGDYPAATEIQEALVVLARNADSGSASHAASVSALAGTRFYAGDYDAADSLNQLVLDMSRRLHGAGHPLVAEDLINLGATRVQRGDYREAEPYFREALFISERWFGAGHPRVASHATMLGRALMYQNRDEEAIVFLNRALAIRERVYGPAHPMVASTINELGNIAVKRERLAEAEIHFSRMVDIYKGAYGERHYLIGIAQGNLAGVLLSRGDRRRAIGLYQDAVRMYADTQGAEHINTGIGRIKLGRALLRDGQFAEAARESQTGYDIVSRQANPGVSFLRAARRDLIEAYDALRMPDKAAHFRAEIADTSGGIAR
jgi:serine/threonine-protein kinase